MAAPHMKAAVVDSDKDSLLSLHKVLEECNYIVTQCENSEQFLSTIREDQTKFQLVIIEVSVTPIDGYELCRLVREYTHIPIIVTSSTCSSAETAEMVKKALHHGASDFLLKPIKVEDLIKINLDVTHKRLVKQEWSHGDEEEDITTNYSVDGGSLEKHKEELVMTTPEQPARKKRRFVWSEESHDAFVKAINKLGPEKAVPKKIMKEMNIMGISGLTREIVASHLQKYRQHLTKQQQQLQLQQCEENIVKPEQDVNQTLMSVPSSDDPIMNSEQQLQATNVGPHQLVHSWPHTVGLLQEPSSYDKFHSTFFQGFDWRQQQPSLYEQNPNPALLMYDPNPSSSAHAQNTNPAHYMDQVVYVDSSNMGLAMDFPTQHEPAGLPSVVVSGLPITPRIEIKSGNLKTCPVDHSLINACPLYHDQYLQPPPNTLNGFCYDFEHNLRLNPVANGGDGQGQNDQIDPQDITAEMLMHRS